MHNSNCPKCGTAFNGDVKTCGSCGAVSLKHLSSLPPHPNLITSMYYSICLPKPLHVYVFVCVYRTKRPSLLIPYPISLTPPPFRITIPS
ncbi:hypothetical protein F5Y05DRAFT_390327 [Hypoxylon sp. FL0543]|nr:hypothetical protein F5Y05DRAFT_390327 [Hypoxylon sp. FL0543]